MTPSPMIRLTGPQEGGAGILGPRRRSSLVRMWTLPTLFLLGWFGCCAARMRGFSFAGYATGPSSFNVPLEATYGRLMDVSYRGADQAGAPWWGHLHPAPGVFNWTKLDLVVSTVLAQNPNMCLLLPVWGTPTWLARDPGSCAPGGGNPCSASVFQSFAGANSLPRSIDAWKEFITALVTRYSVQQRVIYAYEIWNEPVNVMFLNNTGFSSADWEFLAEMQFEAHAIIKNLTEKLPQTFCLHSTDPTLIGTYVIAPSLVFDNNTHMAKLAGNVLQGLASYKQRMGYTYWPVDAMSCHIYNRNHYDPSNPANVQAAGEAWGLLLDQCCRTLAAYNMPHPDQPWLTEIGYTVDQPYPPYDGAFAYQLVQLTYVEAWVRGSRNINTVFWYAWEQQISGGAGGINFSEVGGKPSAAFQAVIDHAP